MKTTRTSIRKKVPLMFGVIVLMIISGCASRAVIKPFSTDECSCAPEGTKSEPDKWCDCCVQHDIAYWQGGTRAERRAADEKFRSCIKSRGETKFSNKAFHAVRIFGSAYLPFSWRWGYGWKYPHAYRPLTSTERDSVQAVIQRTPIESITSHTCGH